VGGDGGDCVINTSNKGQGVVIKTLEEKQSKKSRGLNGRSLYENT
jgi:hypothetical protein